MTRRCPDWPQRFPGDLSPVRRLRAPSRVQRSVASVGEDLGDTSPAPAPAVRPPPPLPFVLGGYGVIVTDPPWKFDDQGGRMKTPYPTMTDDEIRAHCTEASWLASDRAHLWMWHTDAHLELALECVRLMGFRFVATVPWLKTTEDGEDLRMGGGHYLRRTKETCLFAVRDMRGQRKLTGAVRDIPDVLLEGGLNVISDADRMVVKIVKELLIAAPRDEHSAKPELLQDYAERLGPGPYLELFARRRRDKWTPWGNDPAVLEGSTPCAP